MKAATYSPTVLSFIIIDRRKTSTPATITPAIVAYQTGKESKDISFINSLLILNTIFNLEAKMHKIKNAPKRTFDDKYPKPTVNISSDFTKKIEKPKKKHPSPDFRKLLNPSFVALEKPILRKRGKQKYLSQR